MSVSTAPLVEPELVIITGMSGAGRTTGAKVLEDLGYFVIDNLPPSLISRVFELATHHGSSVDRIAMVVDVRGRQFFGDLRTTLDDLRQRGTPLRVLFLDAGDEALVSRFEGERRTHPLAGDDRVVDGIARERGLLSDLRAEADLVVDTTDVTVHQLRERLVDVFAEPGHRGMVVNVVTFGFKNGAPRDADVVLDVRFLPNPHWEESLRPYTGVDQPVRDYVMRDDRAKEFLERVNGLVGLMVPSFEAEGKRYLTVAVGCTGGKHRSVVLGEEIAAYIDELGMPVQVEHRDRLSE
ncbi:MAG: RNase adapter RapZ [Actinobacteria bacterium QS_8_72_14]|nr:MAG: RNase adapter RapZ [Actinobacteria bacterium QS_8_72_14]